MTLPQSPMGPEPTALWSSLYWGPSNVLPGGQCLMPPPSHIHVFRKVGSCPPAAAHRGPGFPRTMPPPYGITSLSVPAHAHAFLPTSSSSPGPPGQLCPVLPAPGWGLSARAASLSTSTRSQSSHRMVGARIRPRPAAPQPWLREGRGLGGAVLGAGRRRGGRRGGCEAPGQARRRERRARERAGSARSGGGPERRPGGGGAGDAAPPELPQSPPGPPRPPPVLPESSRCSSQDAGGGGLVGAESGYWAGAPLD